MRNDTAAKHDITTSYMRKLVAQVEGVGRTKRRLERKQSAVQPVTEEVNYQYNRAWRGRRMSCASFFPFSV